MQQIILYSTGCPMCHGLEDILNKKGIVYTLCTNEDKMRALGITQVPMLSIDGNLLKAPQAMKWALGAK